jgi:hypothetical protein
MKKQNRSYSLQCRLNQKEKDKFEEIRKIIVFESQIGNRLTPCHAFAKEEKVTDADVLRFLIEQFKFQD